MTRRTLARMKPVGVLLIVLGGLWLSVLLVMPVYIEPGPTGDINCGQTWRAVGTTEFSQDDAACHRAMVNRRVVILLPIRSVALGVAAVVLTRRNRQLESN